LGEAVAEGDVIAALAPSLFVADLAIRSVRQWFARIHRPSEADAAYHVESPAMRADEELDFLERIKLSVFVSGFS
jgi:hypothetical protein